MGELGERYFANMLVDKGYVVYGALNGLKCPLCNTQSFGRTLSHPFDFIIFKPSPNGFSFSQAFIAEVKTKRRLWQTETGFDLADYNAYKKLAHASPLPVWIMFVDEKEIYGATIDELAIERKENDIDYPKVKTYDSYSNNVKIPKQVVFFPLSGMHKVGTLTDAQQRKLADVATKQVTK